MFSQIFPATIDNTFRGRKLALWHFALLLAVRIAQSVILLASPYATVANADGIPLQSYPANAAQTIVAIYALYALTRLFLLVLGVIVLVRYRSAIPFMFGLFLLNYLAVQILVRFLPIVRTDAPASIVTRTLIGLTLVGLGLSLWKREDGKLRV